MQRLLAKNPTASFVVLAFIFSYSVGMATLWLAGAWMGHDSDMAAHYLGRAGVVFGPAFAALAVATGTTGRDGVIRLLSRLRPHREDVWWFVLLPSFSLGATVLAYIVTSTPVTAVASALVDGWPSLLANYVLALLIIGIGEELGWRGWLLPKLLTRRSRAKATILVAAVWCPWHLPILLRGGWGALSFAVVVVALSFLFTALWSYARESVLVVALGHASVNAPFFFFESALGPQRSYAAWLMVCAFYSLLTVVLVAVTWRWWQSEAPSVEPAAP